MKKKTTAEVLADTERYITFLEKRLASANYKAAVSADEFNKEKEKLKRAKERVKFLKPRKK